MLVPRAARLIQPVAARPERGLAGRCRGIARAIDVDFGKPVPINTIFLGNIARPATDASWTITGGAAGYSDMIKASGLLRVPGAAGRTSPFSCLLARR
jgi:hypothetical protein